MALLYSRSQLSLLSGKIEGSQAHVRANGVIFQLMNIAHGSIFCLGQGGHVKRRKYLMYGVENYVNY